MVLSFKVSPDLIGGDVDEGYGKLADAFRRTMTGLGHRVLDHERRVVAGGRI